MARPWTIQEKIRKRQELIKFYHRENKSIGEVGKILGIAQSTVFDRMQRLAIPSHPETKLRYLNRRLDIQIPEYSRELAEFTGILLGDGHISPTQLIISLALNEKAYVLYILKLIKKLFHTNKPPRYISRNEAGSYDIYVGSTLLTRFFTNMGLVSHKVKRQVKVPRWIAHDYAYQKSFLRGFFDTDGSMYKLRFGIQMNFSNESIPLLISTRNFLLNLGFYPSKISASKVYLTRKEDIRRYVQEVGFGNPKHLERFKDIGIIPM